MKRIFISGCQRSGTTLLRLLLEAHPAIHCYDEAFGYKILVDETKGKIVDYALKKNARLVVFKIPRFTEQLLRPMFDDTDYGSFPSFYKGEQIIHIVRDVRDVVASMITLKVSSDSRWIDDYGRKILDKQLQHPLVAKRFGIKYREIQAKAAPAHLVGALYWSIKNQGLLDMIKMKVPVHAIRYEELVTKLKRTLIGVCSFIGLPWSEFMLAHEAQHHDELDENGLTIGYTNPLRPVDKKSVGRHFDVLTAGEIGDIDIFTLDIQKKLMQFFS